jgi:hypothetical protein
MYPAKNRAAAENKILDVEVLDIVKENLSVGRLFEKNNRLTLTYRIKFSIIISVGVFFL